MKKVKGGITAPKGFQAAGIAAGIKRSGNSDMALIYSDVPATAAGVFTTNQVKAAPIIVSMKQLQGGAAQAIIANAGNANCWTGDKGLIDAWKMVKDTGRALTINPRYVLVASTGVIAHSMPMPKILAGIKQLPWKLSKKGGKEAARAILTTDLQPKEIAVKVGKITIGGIAKGSGMIAPGMATMLGFITTDAEIGQPLLQKMLRQAVAKTFNMVSVDNCMSTNDCVFVLANGRSGSRVKGQGARRQFSAALEYVCEYLAKAIARDGEGASKLMTVKASGAASWKDARVVVKALINSFLLKAAVAGRDRNFGRILQALGTTDAQINWDKFKFTWKFGKEEDVITVHLGVGKESAAGWGCDLTEGYVKINARYHT
ncbi:MAG: bifunctional glutamate N-acetyltransferase/amino-acid acetyltransferase ArgJ [Candidatus Margulisbacteria bacterium]|nr:bifunctional glutamate N-acetyltransferase/amino-acid acetyltransferase ArgJ [Candidatus Margulisiibacteriota bacterium]